MNSNQVVKLFLSLNHQTAVLIVFSPTVTMKRKNTNTTDVFNHHQLHTNYLLELCSYEDHTHEQTEHQLLTKSQSGGGEIAFF